MRTILGLTLTVMMAGACDRSPAEAPPAAEAAGPVTPMSSPTSSINALSQEEAAAGWKLLFNGQNLSGWKGYKKDVPGAEWQVRDGAIALTAGGGGDLMTTGEYGPFELSLEWKISPGGNSGVIYLIREMEGAKDTYNSGPEMQVLDNDGHPDGKTPSHRAGALYDIETPPDGAVKPVGEWNQALIRFTGTSIEHWLNGVKVATSSYGDDSWRAKVAASKFKQWPMFGTASQGHIALQDHGNQVWYRNIKIRSL